MRRAGAAVALGGLLAVSCGPPSPGGAGPEAARCVVKDRLAGWGPHALDAATLTRVLAEADRAVERLPGPVRTLASAGSTDKDAPSVVATREAFEDADDAVILALAWRSTHAPRYRDAAVSRLLAWARTNVPTGHPIDETRLDALVRAWEIVGCELDPPTAVAVRAWVEALRGAKRAWQFGPKTSTNNHRTHQLKSLLLLDHALGDTAAFARDRAAAEAHAAGNLDAETGASVDLRERGALYYHAYDLDAWLEIVLLAGCCRGPVDAAWRLLERRLLAGQLDGEFLTSRSPLDAARARAGYGYGAPGSSFDVRRATHAILTACTLEPSRPCPLVGRLDPATVPRKDLYSYARYRSWR